MKRSNKNFDHIDRLELACDTRQAFVAVITDQVNEISAVLRGHYAYYGVAGNIRALFKVYRAVERYWRRMPCSPARPDVA